MTLYDRLAATDDGSRALAQGRLRREALRRLHRAQTASGLAPDEIAARLSVRAKTVRRAFDGDRDITVGALAEYLHALRFELDLRLVPAGEPRRAVVEQRDVERERVAEHRAAAQPTPERDGYTIGVFIPACATEEERDRMYNRIAEAAHGAEGGSWDAHVVGEPGDPLAIVHDPRCIGCSYCQGRR